MPAKAGPLDSNQKPTAPDVSATAVCRDFSAFGASSGGLFRSFNIYVIYMKRSTFNSLYLYVLDVESETKSLS